ncbi:hypothetical protein AAF712_007850 [Marasmius tenuissimus]|uniref:Uncharacterized protein n=1 Tax=Marasmius tenuissimus TaxID=585030 RepID=A0ABR2ZV51_9AGAR
MATFLEATNGGIMVETSQRATTTIPTPPRLRTMLKENLCIERWSNTIRTTCEAPGHTPWGNIGDCEAVDWIPEGSVHPYEAFQEALTKARTRREAWSAPDAQVKVITEPQDSAKRRRRQTTCDSTHRKALVFEREITLDAGGEVKRWSLQVPAVDMSPDMVDVMLELRRLNSFFKEESDEPMMTPPALMISNSHSAMALSLPSTASLHSSPVPKTLAIRRGNLPLPPLLTKSEVPGILELEPYPSIPSAFLGASYSAVSQSHDRQNPHTISKPSGGFKDMINTLRSQCATLQIRQSPHATDFDESKQGPLADASHTADEEDEWSFARPLLEKYGDQPYLRDPPLNSKVASPSGAAATVTTFCTAGFADIGTDTARNSDKYSCPGSLVHDSLTTITPPFKKGTGGHSASRSTQQSPDGTTGSRSIEIIDTSALALSSISPSSDRSPSPRSSSPCNPVTPSPRGILKRCKSVRFAESPIEDNGSVIEADRFPPARLRHSLGSSLQQSPPSKRPAPLRSTYSSNNNRTTGRSTPSSTSTATDFILTPSLRAAGRQKSPSTYGKVNTKPPASSEKPSRNSTAVLTTSPPRFKATLPTRRLTRGERAGSQVSATGTPVVFPTPKPKSTSACSSPTRSRIEAARQTIDASSMRPRASTGALRAVEKHDKENHAAKLKARASMSASTYRGRHTIDEGVLRRDVLDGKAEAQGSGGGAGPSPTSRMPVPLRKILTRFK